MNLFVTLTNETDLRAIPEDRIVEIGEPLLTAHGLEGEWLVDVRFVDPGTMRALNRDAQGLDEPTDVLSFPVQFATNRPDPITDWPAAGPKLLGSVVIAPEVAAAQAGQHGRSIVEEIEWLVDHAFRHLLGHDHDAKGHWLTRSSTDRVESE